MKRMRDLIERIKREYPEDQFFVGVGESLRIDHQARTLYRAYDRAIDYLDPQSWAVLADKAVKHFRDHRKGMLKQGFFNQLNDAFAYQYLARRGCSQISVLREGRSSVPDLRYRDGREWRHCEVKTVSESDDEIARRGSGNAFDSGKLYGELSPEYLRKFSATLERGFTQIAMQGTDGLVFVVAHFDDFTGQFFDRYRAQLEAALGAHEAREVYVKVGLIGGRRIYKAPTNRE